MFKPFFLVGATAVGKTALAVQLAERVGAEIVNADAFQVYCGFDRLTAKPSTAQRARVPHHLIGHVPAHETYNVARFVRDARACLEEAASRGKPSLVVGGSGLYVKALTHGLAALPESDPALRAELETASEAALFARLQGLDPEAARHIDVHNKRRLVRAVEVCLVTGRPFSAQRTGWEQSVPVGLAGVFLVRDRAELLDRISRRTAALLSTEALEEVRRGTSGPLSPTAERIIGLSESRSLLAGTLDANACRERIVVATRQYAKRQVTWFKREECFTHVSLSGPAVVASPLETLEAMFQVVQRAG